MPEIAIQTYKGKTFNGVKILKLKPRNFEKIIRQVTRLIKRGEVIVCPTDTVYGLVCNATNKKAVEKLFKIKRRSLKKPVPIFVKDIKMAKKLAYIDKSQEKFLKEVWPGKVTLILKAKGKSQKVKVYGIDKKTIGLRIPNYKLINQLLLILNHPLTGTSANISGKPSSTKIKEIIKQFRNQKYQPDLIIDAGNLPESRPSTVIDLTGEKPKVLRK